MDPRIKHLSSKVLLLNLFITQGIMLLIGVLAAYFFFIRNGEGWENFFNFPLPLSYLWLGVGGAILVIGTEILFTYFLPEEDFDDGGINEKLFRSLNFPSIALVTFFIAFTEELLFRGVIQEFLGLWVTAVIFTVVHVRYLKKWLMVLLVFSISVLFGWLFEYTGSLWTPIVAHFLIDYILAMFIRMGWFQTEKEEKADKDEDIPLVDPPLDSFTLDHFDKGHN